jgi:hypothetical protein
MDNRTQIREFLASRRARITPGQAGLPAYGGHRRVTGLRREEVALLAGVSIDYYVRMERGNLAGARPRADEDNTVSQPANTWLEPVTDQQYAAANATA